MHKTWLEISRRRILHNLKQDMRAFASPSYPIHLLTPPPPTSPLFFSVFRSRVGPSVEVCPVIKATAYGHGAGEVCSILARNGVTRVAVATVAEVQALRAQGATCSILLLGSLHPCDAAAAAAATATPVLSSIEGIAAWYPTPKITTNFHLKQPHKSSGPKLFAAAPKHQTKRISKHAVPPSLSRPPPA